MKCSRAMCSLVVDNEELFKIYKCSFILVSALYRVPYRFKEDLLPAKSHYFCYIGNYNICTVYTHVIQWDLHNMKGISALISRTTCTTSQVLVSGYSFNSSISMCNMLNLPVNSQGYSPVTSDNPRKPVCVRT